ncbi:hypothetical protein [Candidatus Bealeia paramacronuclearis]|uniref:hypothetical protein n=1 Tax=Candidatus Bealeia paramacronuclearis TaxID=1921001 RepID=UPI0030D6138D
MNQAKIFKDRNNHFGEMEVFESESGARSLLDKKMALLYGLIEKFHLADCNFFLRSGLVESVKDHLIATTFINVDLIWATILLKSLFEESLSRYGVTLIAKQKINCMAKFINSLSNHLSRSSDLTPLLSSFNRCDRT